MSVIPPVQHALRRLTQLTRPLALRSAGTSGSPTSVIRHVGRTSGRPYQTPVVAVEHQDGFLVALPYGDLTDWVKNVLASGHATVINEGHSYDVDQPEVLPMSEATQFFQPKEQKLHRRFKVDTCLQVRVAAHPSTSESG